jgi:hypothetical protein
MSNAENKAPEIPEQQEPLSEEQLDDVSAGLNPQPLPPIVRDHV